MSIVGQRQGEYHVWVKQLLEFRAGASLCAFTRSKGLLKFKRKTVLFKQSHVVPMEFVNHIKTIVHRCPYQHDKLIPRFSQHTSLIYHHGSVQTLHWVSFMAVVTFAPANPPLGGCPLISAASVHQRRDPLHTSTLLQTHNAASKPNLRASPMQVECNRCSAIQGYRCATGILASLLICLTQYNICVKVTPRTRGSSQQKHFCYVGHPHAAAGWVASPCT